MGGRDGVARGTVGLPALTAELGAQTLLVLPVQLH